MFYENKTLCTILFFFCIFGAIFSPMIPEQVQAKSIPIETKTQTWKVETRLSKPLANSWTISKSDKKEWRKDCDSVCKSLELQRLWIIEPIANSLITNCKALSSDPRKCIIIWASIVKNESGGWLQCKKSNKYNCMGLSVKADYKSYNDGVLHWIAKYEKHWYKAENSWFFYPDKWKVSPSRFCTSEYSSGSDIGCPNGKRNAQMIWEKLDKIF